MSADQSLPVPFDIDCPVQDLALRRELGLETEGYGPDFRTIGGIRVGGMLIEVEVAAVSATFWRFHVVREGRGTYVIETDSGLFSGYWWIVKLMAAGVIRRGPRLTGAYAARFAALVVEARGWCLDCAWEELDAETQIEEADPYQIVRAVARTYDGGWRGFCQDAAL